MAIHEELNPDDAALPFLTARGMRMLATDNAARTAGVIVVPNLDGTNTVLGDERVGAMGGGHNPARPPVGHRSDLASWHCAYPLGWRTGRRYSVRFPVCASVGEAGGRHGG